MSTLFVLLPLADIEVAVDGGVVVGVVGGVVAMLPLKVVVSMGGFLAGEF